MFRRGLTGPLLSHVGRWKPEIKDSKSQYGDSIFHSNSLLPIGDFLFGPVKVTDRFF